jgi:hypothetical protein
MSRFKAGDVLLSEENLIYTVESISRGSYTVRPQHLPHRTMIVPINWADANMTLRSVPLQVGDTVTMLESSMYNTGTAKSNPFGIDGVVCNIDGEDEYSVEWSNNYHNGAYTNKDIVLVSSNSVTVSSLDYLQDGNLTTEDKEIIKEALSNV